MLHYADFERRWASLAVGGTVVRRVACIGAPRTLLVAELGNVASPCVTICAGVHGDERAAPWALLSAVEDGLLDGRFSYRLWPCTNPSGYEAGTRENAEGDDINRSFSRGGTTPEARAIIAANRDRAFALSLDLHEDLEGTGFYCYEPHGEGALAERVIAGIDDAGLPIQEFAPGFDLAYPADAVHVKVGRGYVVPDVAAESKHFAGLPYSLYVGKRAARHALTLEAPATREWMLRIAMHRVAIVTSIAAMLKEFVEQPGHG